MTLGIGHCTNILQFLKMIGEFILSQITHCTIKNNDT